MIAPLCGVVYALPLAFNCAIQASGDPALMLDPAIGLISQALGAGFCIAGIIMRNQFRSQKNIDGNLIEDILCDHSLPATSAVGGHMVSDLLCFHIVTCRCGGCCNACTLCQMQRHIKNDGADSGIEQMER